MTVSRVFCLIAFLWLLPSQDFSLRVESAVAPTYPARTYDSGVAVVLMEMDRLSKRTNTEMVYGRPPFISAALDAVTHWRFKPSSQAHASRTSITFVFRPRSIERVPLPVKMTGAQIARPDRPPLPLEIFDPGYPPMSVAEGAVVLELSVDAKGGVVEVRPIVDIPSLTGAVEMEAKSWKFSPAMAGGKPVSGNAIVVISFVHPAL